jgi:hypothetical protein
MPYLGNVPAENYAQVSYQDLTGGSGTSFTLDYPVGSAGEIEVFVNNVRQEPTVAYTVSGTSLTMTGSIAATDDFYVVFQGKAQQTIGIPEKQTDGTYVFPDDVTVSGNITSTGIDDNATSTAITLDNSNNVGIGTSSPDTLVEVSADSGNASIKLARSNTASTDDDFGSIVFENSVGTTLASIRSVSKSGNTEAGITFGAGGSDATRMTLDNGGNLLVGKTTTAFGTAGVRLANTENYFTVNSSATADFNRLTSDGDIVKFYKDGTVVGRLGTQGTYLHIEGSTAGAYGLKFVGSSYIRPSKNNGLTSDNELDLGTPTARFDDIYATNGTIQTSDRNEKQNIEELSEAEKRVATAAKGLIRKFRWIDAVAEKGDDARIHVGVIAQDLQAAFEAEGLDAGRYAMFISSTWWEATETYNDDDGVEQTRVNIYETAEEAPEGAVERTRLGVRYPELLAFIIGAL